MIIKELENRDATDDEIYQIKNECQNGSEYLKELKKTIDQVHEMNLGD